jgi:hypothetical protein
MARSLPIQDSTTQKSADINHGSSGPKPYAPETALPLGPALLKSNILKT